jgi:ABC-type Zn2+ transport system substrate-binding protein/surface adhesin
VIRAQERRARQDHPQADDQADHHQDHPTVEMLMPATWVVTANLRIAPTAIANKLNPIVIV